MLPNRRDRQVAARAGILLSLFTTLTGAALRVAASAACLTFSSFAFFAFQAGGDETTTTFFRRTTPGAGVASAGAVLFSAGFRFRLSTGRFSSLIRGHINKSYRSVLYDTLTVSSFHLAMQWTQR